ncbi:MAG: ABC transporter ATP-binding protein [Bdellovibrionales bacterium]|nr:ABC transporter ATP-binding protein [Bdellovibrionales bacterium]
MNSSTCLTLRNVLRTYSGHPVLRIPELSFQRNDIVILAGPNGAGKSTLLRLLSGAISADRGVIEWFPKRPSVSYFEEGFGLFEDLTVQEHFAFVARFRATTWNRECLKDYGLQSVAHQRVAHLSKGWRARVALGLTFFGEPQVLLLDEPLNGLDDSGRTEFIRLLGGRTFELCIVATHEVEWLHTQLYGTQKVQHLQVCEGVVSSVNQVGT